VQSSTLKQRNIQKVWAKMAELVFEQILPKNMNFIKKNLVKGEKNEK
jgi:hypothetical protein